MSQALEVLGVWAVGGLAAWRLVGSSGFGGLDPGVEGLWLSGLGVWDCGVWASGLRNLGSRVLLASKTFQTIYTY